VCGIITYSSSFNYPIDEALLSIKHRGPDKSNYFSDEDIFIGHALLQIRGRLNSSVQPKISKNKRYILVYNGQIYNLDYIKNYIDIKKDELDTNCILKLLDKFGIDGLKYIDGMYAIVVYDVVNKELIFTRDPSGQKHLYYYVDQNSKIIVSSEIKTILNIKNNKNFLSALGIKEFFSIGLNPNNYTFIKGIYKLLPGEIICYSIKKKSIIKKYFLKKKISTIKLTNKNLIKKNILSHLSSKKKIALNLSGGIDSNLILNEIIKSGKKIDIFSTFCESQDKNFNNDFYIARSIAKKLNLKFIETYVTKKIFFDNIIKVIETVEEPNRNSANTLYFLNFKNQAEQGYRTILSGAGGDEVFIGYQNFFFSRKYQKLLNKIYDMTNAKAIYHWLIHSLIDNKGKYCLPSFFFKNNYLDEKQDFTKIISNNISNFQKSLFNLKKFYSLNFLKLIYGQFTWLASETYLSMDKLGMINSVEMRSPFSSYDFTFKQMSLLKESHFTSEHNKPLIREIYKNDLFKEVIDNKKKTGWPIPKEWLLSKDFKSLLLDFIPKTDNNYFSFVNIRKYIEKNPEHLNRNYFYSLLTFLVLCKKYKI
jgi:asparagine synthase (glutamine-hydrolysing)